MRGRDAQGTPIAVKRGLQWALGWASYPLLFAMNRLVVRGVDHLRDLPLTGVLFASNHQTYYMDVIGMIHAFGGAFHRLSYLTIPPRLGHVYYVAAEETMLAAGWLPKLFTYTGAINIKRSWKYGEEEVDREVDLDGAARIGHALTRGWVITFPQGTTEPDAPGRIGTARLVRQFRPLVVPTRIEGFGRAFHRSKPFVMRDRNVPLSIEFRAPLALDYSAPAETILDLLMEGIQA